MLSGSSEYVKGVRAILYAEKLLGPGHGSRWWASGSWPQQILGRWACGSCPQLIVGGLLTDRNSYAAAPTYCIHTANLGDEEASRTAFLIF